MRSLNVVFAWELGSGMGHVGRHLDLARVLVRRGGRVTFILKDLRLASTLLRGAGFRCLQAPQIARPQRPSQPILSYADILAYHGMADKATGLPLLHAWSDLFELCQTDVVLLDHAPAALCAAKCCGVKTIGLDTGFYCPPSQVPFPSFRPWEKAQPGQLLEREAACLQVVNGFATLHDVPCFGSLADAIRSDVPLLTSFPELDHYPQRRGGKYVGPAQSFNSGAEVRWRGDRRYKIFVYLHGIPEVDQALRQLEALDAEYIVFCPDLSAEQRSALPGEQFQLAEGPVSIECVLQDCDLVISNGGHGLMSACVLFGVNALVIPLYIEQRLMADCLRRAGTGSGVLLSRLNIDLVGKIVEILENDAYKAAARDLRQKYHRYDLVATLERLANTVSGLRRGDAGAGRPKPTSVA